ncbi:DNA topoisomerase IB [Smaragdicoccus niigatensis]|uniref:DNA topoisomerase IB n=1 Tax=Smaragdicoccus niigatensis TaxID=359359 RepID=UPI0003A15150|nr:DNA topoisomerase IB [Smaragdicoccus niigatensis]
MRLRRVNPNGPGLKRIRRGRGFSYVDSDGSRVTDPELLERIQQLVIPPAWRNVWICERPNGHIQAVGEDAAGRRQYIYHEQWRNDRDEEKFDRMLELAAALPDLRAQVHQDLASRGLTRRRVEAVAIVLLDRGVFRVGGEAYADENGTHGVSTLLRSHVQVSGDRIRFDFTAKGGIRHQAEITDHLLATAIRALKRSPSTSERLLMYRHGDEFRELHADDINDRIHELTGCACTAKDFRTWHGTVMAAAAFAETDRPTSKREMTSTQRRVMEEVAQLLGNTPAIAKGSYVDPRIIRAYEHGATIERALKRAAQKRSKNARQSVVDKAVVATIRSTSA